MSEFSFSSCSGSSALNNNVEDDDMDDQDLQVESPGLALPTLTKDDLPTRQNEDSSREPF